MKQGSRSSWLISFFLFFLFVDVDVVDGGVVVVVVVVVFVVAHVVIVIVASIAAAVILIFLSSGASSYSTPLPLTYSDSMFVHAL